MVLEQGAQPLIHSVFMNKPSFLLLLSREAAKPSEAVGLLRNCSLRLPVVLNKLAPSALSDLALSSVPDSLLRLADNA